LAKKAADAGEDEEDEGA
jgi:hypothetical protein